ncbi:MAG: polyphosphate kinase 2 family protein [Bryobacteraceae bacterium]
MSSLDRCLVKPGHKVRLADFDPDSALHFRDKAHAEKLLPKNIERLAELQSLLYADRRFALLIVLQALDAGGKDGAIRHVMSGVNPQGCRVTSFKVPSAEEASHDFLWRVHQAVPERGDIGIFNRSQYEDVLVARVHKLVPHGVWSERYAQINSFERMLAENNVKIVKFFLHISKGEQKKRFEERIDTPSKNWKISDADFAERRHWNEYQRAYEDVLRECSTGWAPWYVIPSNKKWVRNLAISGILIQTLESLKLRYPRPRADLKKLKVT